MNLLTRSALVLGCVAVSAHAGEAPGRITFTKNVLPILQQECQTCHRPSGLNLSGMVAPMSLMTYEEVRPWAKAVAKVVEAKTMPPWHASAATHGIFRNERTLSDTEIATVTQWVASGAAKGNPADAPAPIEWPNTGWNFGVPDLVLGFDEPFLVADGIEDLYKDITVQLTEEQLPEDRWISGIEFKPGSEVVHHIIGYSHAPGEAIGGTGEDGSQDRGMLGGNAPGADQDEWPEGYGILLKKGSRITFAMHYHKESGPGTGVLDSSEIGFQFHTKPVQHPIEISNIAYGTFEIPPNEPHWRVGASRLFEEDTILLGLLPHMHLRGSSAKYTAFYPDGKTELLLDVPKYNFNWQTGYKYATSKLIPAGTRIEMEFVYDNSAASGAEFGFDSNKSIRFGGPTTDEMDLAWITIAPAKPLDVASAHPASRAGAGD